MEVNQAWVLQRATDDVATALKPLSAGTVIHSAELAIDVVIKGQIPFGHKFAVRDLSAGSHVHKYGQVIGRATQAIHVGEHVHVHNLESLRGRGDLHGGELLDQDPSLSQG